MRNVIFYQHLIKNGKQLYIQNDNVSVTLLNGWNWASTAGVLHHEPINLMDADGIGEVDPFPSPFPPTHPKVGPHFTFYIALKDEIL
jgi:hypothetical protein